MIKVGVYGATGYTGIELVKILLSHPKAELSFLTSETYKGERFSSIFPCLLDRVLVGAGQADLSGVDAVFTCLPHTRSMTLIREIYHPGLKIIDLSADFRFDRPELYSQWYNTGHEAPELIGKSAYGLCELFRKKIKKAEIAGNPGCYPTAVLLALAPLAKSGILSRPGRVVVDAKSGISGAGRKPGLSTQFAEVDENLIPYKIGRVHRHVGEMEYVLSSLAGSEIQVVFTPHLVPLCRGILCTIYVESGTHTPAEIYDLFRGAYDREPFVHMLEPGIPAQLRYVQNNNGCVIGVQDVPGTGLTVVTSAIDNLVKGASGQAVQNFNIMFSLAETTGLVTVTGS